MKKITFILVAVFLLTLPLISAEFNVRNYGAVGDGVVDDRLAVQSAIQAAYQAGGGTVYLPAGVYLVSETTHPFDVTCGLCLWVSWNITLQGEGIGLTTIKRAANGVIGPRNSSVVMNRDPWALGIDHDIIFRDLTIDGNSANNTLVPAQLGIKLIRAQRASFERVRVKNVRGTGNHLDLEGFHVEFQLGDDADFEDCEVLSDDGGQTGSGFSCDKASNVEYRNCKASGMLWGMGYTMWKCNDIRYFNCSGYRNNTAGFHTEWSYDVLYEDCTTDGGGRWTYAGISPTSSYNVTIVGLLSQNNKHGIYVTDSPGGHPANLSISDSTFINCRRAGIWLPNANKNKPITIWDITMKSVPRAFYVTGTGGMSLAAGLKKFAPVVKK